MAVKYTCDICGQETEQDGSTFTFDQLIMPHGRQAFDLCDDCDTGLEEVVKTWIYSRQEELQIATTIENAFNEE